MIKHDMRGEKSRSGFTIIEVLVAMVILGILAGVAIPGFSVWLPDHRLKSAAMDLYSNMQLARMGAIKANANWAIVFTEGSDSYRVCSDDGGDGDWKDGDETVVKTVNLASYGSGVAYGYGSATDDIPENGAPPADDITYTIPAADVAVFNPRGTGSGGYVYLANNKNTTSYGTGTRNTGVIYLLKWNSSISKWK